MKIMFFFKGSFLGQVVFAFLLKSTAQQGNEYRNIKSNVCRNMCFVQNKASRRIVVNQYKYTW